MRKFNFTEKIIQIQGTDLLNLTGINEENINKLREHFYSTIIVRGESVILKGEEKEVLILEKIFKELSFLQGRQGKITQNDIKLVLELTNNNDSNYSFKNNFGINDSDIDNIILYKKNDFIKPKTATQIEYAKKVKENDIVFAIGPAGTGKTYLAVAFAVSALKNKQINKIVLSRPAVEAGESLGFLPGDLSEKIDPYLKPLYDALEDMIPMEKLKFYIEKNIIEIVPLAYMRGRTLNNSFVMLDEAQNSTNVQIKMFLTRLGPNSKAIITGDITQIDLPGKEHSGLVQIQNVLKGIEDIEFVYFNKNDVVRHRLVRNIIEAYERYDGI
ncbi:MAG: PhoH family protein [Ignavibacteriae bacterium]|nr:PhoH family protein [Ignavibacteriota bacterium]